MLSRHTKLAGCVLGLVLISAPVRAAHGQSLGSAMAYSALTLTPAAGLPSTPLTSRDGGMAAAFGLRYGHAGPNSNNVALGWYIPAGDGQVGLTAGTTLCSGCSN